MMLVQASCEAVQIWGSGSLLEKGTNKTAWLPVAPQSVGSTSDFS